MTMQRSHGVMAGVAVIVLASAAIAMKQQAGLSAVRAEIERFKRAAGPEPASQKEVREPREVTGQSPADLSLSNEGAGLLAEARELIVRLAPALLRRYHSQPFSEAEEDDEDRLKELMAGMGGATFRNLLADLASTGMDKNVELGFRAMFSQMNPQQSLVWRLGEEPGKEREQGAELDFREWVRKEPGAALKWFLAAEAAGEPVTRLKSVIWNALRAEARLDPVRAVARISRMADERPEMLQGEISRIGLPPESSPRERIALVNALNALADQPGANPVLIKTRDRSLAGISSLIFSGVFRDGSAVVDACYSPRQKLDFARELVSSAEVSPLELPKWASWIAALDGLPVDDSHPLAQMASVAGMKGSSADRDPTWIDTLPSPELRELATAKYVERLSDERPDKAAKWLVRLPAGEVRRRFAQGIFQSWQVTDPAAAAAFEASEKNGGNASPAR